MFLLLKSVTAAKKEGQFLCDICFCKQKNFEGFCYICKKKSANFKLHKKCVIENKLLSGRNFNEMKVFFDRIIVLSHYKNKVIKKLILHFKFFGKKEVGIELSLRMIKLLNKNINISSKCDYLVLPVPMFFIRKVFRGYNQSEILAHNISKGLGVRYNSDVLIRSRHTRQQAKLSQKERVENLSNAFKIDKRFLEKIDKKSIILVDDVISTGTTVNEISKLLKKNGVKNVAVLCLASN